MINQYVYAQLPNSGLGNMLLVWAKALVFARINSFIMLPCNWGKIKIGPFLRREFYYRYYGNFFHEKSEVSGLEATFIKSMAKKIYEPSIQQLDLNANELANFKNLYIFDEIPHWSDYFLHIREYHKIVKSEILYITNSAIIQSIQHCSAPQIGIHVRLSDFRTLQNGEDFRKFGSVRTPISWYCHVLKTIRELVGYNVPATIFSDGYDYELIDLLKLPEVNRSPKDSAIADLLTLSKSKLLIASAGSTFSGWASYLGRCPTIWVPGHFHAGLFPSDISQNTFEGTFDPGVMDIPDLLKKNIMFLFKK